MESSVRVIGLVLLMAAATGCSYISAFGGDSSTLVVERQCDVNLKQAAHVAGREESEVVESVRINERCEVEVDFRQNVAEQ